MILTDINIKEAVASGELKIEGFDPDNVQPASYDLTVGPEGFSTTARRIVNIQETGLLVLKAGDYGLVTTYELLELPTNYVARFGLRSQYLRKGLIAAVGPQIDPGYRGRLVLGLMNLSPSDIVLAYREQLCSVEFHKLREAAGKPYSGPYQDKLRLSSSDVEPLIRSEGMAFSEILTTLRSLSATVQQLTHDVSMLTHDVSTLKWWTVSIVGAGIGIIAILVGLK